MLTPNQELLLGHIAKATSPVSLESLAGVKNPHGDAFGENAVRNSCKRMEENGWVTGSGVGRLRSFAVTSVGEAVLREPLNGSAPPEPADPDSGRQYVVLEEVLIGDLDDSVTPLVYVIVEKTNARNTEAALRHVAKENFEDGTPRLVAVSEKMWQVTPVEVKSTRSVSIGG